MTCEHHGCEPHVSRRKLLQAGSFAAGAGVILAANPVAAQSAKAGSAPGIAGTAGTAPSSGNSPFAPSTDYLGMAKSAADWIIANQTTDEYGAYFPADAANPKREFIADSAPDCFYSGIAGMIVTFAELAQKTGEARYRDAAVAGAERLLKRWPEIAAKPIPALDMRWAITFGIAGIGMALHQVGTMLGEPRYTAALRPIAERIVAAADHDNPKGTWTEYAGYLTDAGTVLFLVQSATLLGDRKIKNTAVKAGDRLISLATRESDGSLAWKISHNPSYPERFYPGFEYGQAGTVYTLAAIYEATREQRFLDAAKRGTQYLMGLAVGNAQAALLPYALPDSPDLFYLGFCHGAAGTARLFYKLHNITGERIYLDWTTRLANGILATGAPELESPGMWNTSTQCCGVASHVTLFLGLWARYGNPEYLEIARRSARTISSRANNLDGKGDKWFMAWSRVDPNIVNAETGYMIGSAGIATALLHLHLAESGRYDVTLPWDTPFPQRRA